ncbi:MAG: PLP-dependent aspartate aminotransferase family protein [Candidatus Micrarchaeia archaeon]|jgi:cystathionine gamma-lyase
MKFATGAVRAGEEPAFGEGAGDVVCPIHLSTTFARRRAGKPTRGFEYSRSGNPTRLALEKRLAELEGGFGALAYSSGLAAEANALFLLESGDRVLANDDLYGGTYRLFAKCFSKFGVGFGQIDFNDEESIRANLKSGVKMVWLETPSNPLLKVYDIEKIARIAHGHDRDVLVVVDNTFASPFFQNPLRLGADLVVHSTTKYIGGHSDVVGGALIAKSKDVFEKLKFFQNAIGAIASPFDSFLALRGLKTLHVRMEKHGENAMAIAKWLEHHPKIAKVNYPGLPSHPGHAIAKKQMSGFSGMVSFEVKGGAKQAKAVAEGTKLFMLAESLGGVESLIEHPASMTHASIPAADRQKNGLGGGLVRISVGIEDADDLIADLDRALRRA